MDVVSGERYRTRRIANVMYKINFISKAPGLPDAPIVNEGRDYQPFGPLSINGPKVADYLKEMNKEVLSVSTHRGSGYDLLLADVYD